MDDKWCSPIRMHAAMRRVVHGLNVNLRHKRSSRKYPTIHNTNKLQLCQLSLAILSLPSLLHPRQAK